MLFRVIFLGETFTGFILVSNSSSEQVKDVVLKVLPITHGDIETYIISI